MRHVEVSRAGGMVAVEIDGHVWQIDAVRIDAHTLSLLVDGARVQDLTVTPDPATGQLLVRVGATVVPLALNGRRRFGRRAQVGAAGSGPQRVVAPMPGKIVRVLVTVGDEVLARQPIAVIEAMKMENELRAVRGGKVSEVHATEGASVDAGALLVVIQ